MQRSVENNSILAVIFDRGYGIAQVWYAFWMEAASLFESDAEPLYSTASLSLLKTLELSSLWPRLKKNWRLCTNKELH